MGRIDGNNPDPPQDYDTATSTATGDDATPPPPTDDTYYYNTTTPADNQSDQAKDYNQQYQQQQPPPPPQPTPAPSSYPPQNYHQPPPPPPQQQQPPPAQYPPPPSNAPQPVQFPPRSPQMAPRSYPPQASPQPYLNPQQQAPQAYPMKPQPQQYPPAAGGGYNQPQPYPPQAAVGYNQQQQQYYPSPAGQYQMKPDASPVGGIPIGSQYLPPTEGWKSSLLDCMDDPENAIITACFPCVTFGQIAEVIDNGQTSCATSGLLYGLIAAFIGVPCIMSCGYRSKLRSKYGLIETPAPDWVTHCFCEPCALCQEYRELKHRGVDPAIGWQGNLARNNIQMQQATMTPPVNQTMMG